MKALERLEKAGFARRLWAKDPGLWKDDAAHAAIIRDSLGWLAMPETMARRLAELEAFASEARKASFEHAAVLGMGGSSLACEVLRRHFPPAGGPKLHVLDSTHPEAVAALEREAPPAKTLYFVSSKSGTTVEPSRFFDYFWSRVEDSQGPGAGAHFVAITDPGTALESLARERRFRRTFLNFPDIGGRYSALSYFGLVPAAVLGVDVRGLLERARALARACGPERPLAENPGASLGAWLGDAAAAGRDKITFHIHPRLEALGLWLEQLIAESVGKEGKGVVPVCGEPLLDPGAYGPDRAFVFIGVAPDPRLAKAGHPVLEIPVSDPLELGAEFFRWEVATAALGQLLGIDPFDQPDVQSAKDRTKAALEALSKAGSLPRPQSPAPAELLRGSKPGDYVGLLAYLPEERLGAEVLALRRAIERAGRCPVQLGYGPRYLHSTGQLHKGGPDSGLFLVIDQAGAKDQRIPGQPYSFGQLCSAQALGDFAALRDAGKRAAYVRLEGDAKEALRRLAREAEEALASPSRK